MKKFFAILLVFLISICIISCDNDKQVLSEEEKESLTYSEVADVLDRYIDKKDKDYKRGESKYWDYVASIITDDAWKEIVKDKEYSQYTEELIDFSWATRMLNEKTGQSFKIDKKTKLPVPLQDKTMKEIRAKYGETGKMIMEENQ